MLRPLLFTRCIMSTLTASFTGTQAAEAPAAAEITTPSSTLRIDAASTEAAVQRPAVTFDRTIHFIAGEGSDVQLSAGIYGVERAGQERLRLLPSDNQPPIEIQAASIEHDESLPAPVSLAVIEEGQDDQVHLVLLLPDGQGLDATGTFSGTRSRGSRVQPINRLQMQQALNQIQPFPQRPSSSPLLRVSPAAAAVTATSSTESVETSGPGEWITWNYLSMHHPEIVAQALADVQTSKQPRASVAGLASDVELNDMLKTDWTTEVSRLNSMREAGVTQGGVTPRGLPSGLSLSDQFTSVTPQKSPLSPIVKSLPPASDQVTAIPQKSPLTPILKALPITLPPRNLGSVWAGQQAMAIVSFTAPADGYVEGRFNLNATNRHFRIVNAIAYTGEVVNRTLAVSLIIPGGQYQDVVLDPANPPAQISKAGFLAILAKKGQRIDFTIAFEPVGLGMTPVGDNEATLELSGATSTEINILSPNAPTTTWRRTALIRARFEGINFGVLGAIDNTAITVFYDGTPCGRLIPVPAGITFHNAEQQARSVSVTAESLSPALHVLPFTVSLAPGEHKHVPISLQIDSCPAQGIEQTGAIRYAYAGVVRRAEFGVTLYPNIHHWENTSKSVGSCDYSWDIYIHPDGTTRFVYSLRNRNLVSQMQLDLRFSVLGQQIGGGVLQDGPNTIHTKYNGYTIPSSFVRDNYVRLLSATAQVGLRCHTPGY